MKVLQENDYKIVVPTDFKSSSIIDAMNAEIPRALFRIESYESLLLHIYVPSVLRGRGIAKKMLLLVATECLKNNCKSIEVDDMSDRYRSEKNLYVKCGFKYKNDSGPEMHLFL